MQDSHRHGPQELSTTSLTLLDRLREDDPQAWAEFVRLYSPVVRYWILGCGVSRSDLPDVFQEVFLDVSRRLPRFVRQPGQAKTRAWLKRITHGKSVDHHRRREKSPQGAGGTTGVQLAASVPDDPLEDDGEEWQPNERQLLLRQTVRITQQAVGERTWQAFWRTTADGQNATAVGEELGMSPAAVRKAKSRVAAQIRQRYAEVTADPLAVEESG